MAEYGTQSRDPMHQGVLHRLQSCLSRKQAGMVQKTRRLLQWIFRSQCMSVSNHELYFVCLQFHSANCGACVRLLAIATDFKNIYIAISLISWPATIAYSEQCIHTHAHGPNNMHRHEACRSMCRYIVLIMMKKSKELVTGLWLCIYKQNYPWRELIHASAHDCTHAALHNTIPMHGEWPGTSLSRMRSVRTISCVYVSDTCYCKKASLQLKLEVIPHK